MCKQHGTSLQALVDEVPAHQLMCRTEFTNLLAEAKTSTPPHGYKVLSTIITPYPHYSVAELTVTFAVAAVGVIERPDGTHTLTAVEYYRDASGAEVFAWFCFDKLLRGALSTEELDERLSICLQKIQVPLRKQAEKTFKAALGLGTAYEVSNCGYWAHANKAKPNIYTCPDTKALLDAINKQSPDVSLDKQLIAEYNKLLGVIEGAVSVSSKEVTFRNYAFSQPILFVGESGSGKTRQAYQFAKEQNAELVKLSCEAGTSSIDILGFYMKAPDGNMLWVDGAMTEAFRKAASGIKTVLLIDELLRPDIREISIFLTALDPDPFTGQYVLRTGRILSSVDGVAVTETLRVSPENLCVIATTNMGGKYNVGEMDKALSDRFVMFRIDTTEAGVIEAAAEACRANGLPEVLAQKCGAFWKAMKASKAQNLVSETPTKRIILRAIAHSTSPQQLPLHLKAMGAHWVSLDGEGFPVASQLTTVNFIIDKAFK